MLIRQIEKVAILKPTLKVSQDLKKRLDEIRRIAPGQGFEFDLDQALAGELPAMIRKAEKLLGVDPDGKHGRSESGGGADSRIPNVVGSREPHTSN